MSVLGLWQVYLSNKLAFDDAWMPFATRTQSREEAHDSMYLNRGSRHGDCQRYHDTAAESIQKVLT